MFKILVILLLQLKFISYKLIECQNLPQIPCPNLFTYKFDEAWYGFVQVPSPVLGDTLKLQVELSLPVQLPTKDVGKLELAYPRMIALQRIVHNKPTQYKIKFPIPQPIPKLTAIIYNSHTICSGSPIQGRFVTKIQLEHTLFTEGAKQQVENHWNLNPTAMYEDRQKYPMPNQMKFPLQFLFNNNQQSYYLLKNEFSHPNNQIQSSSKASPQQLYPQKEPTTANPFWSTLPDEDLCGMIDNQIAIKPLVVGGTKIKRGEWPWLVGIYSTDGSTLSFKCGGNLIAKRLVVTAAHCINIGSKVYKANEIITYLGRFRITRWELEEGAMVRESAIVTAHPDYMRGNSNSFDADIAIIVFKVAVTYNKYIRPICLWTSTNELREIEGRNGRVVGWGRDGDGNIVTPEPRKIDIPIVPEITCLRSSETFRQITSNRTFCAGNRIGSGPCSGDSGGGLALKNGGRWTLRGIVSVAALDPVTNMCNLNEYVVFTDAAKFTDWIQNFMSL